MSERPHEQAVQEANLIEDVREDLAEMAVRCTVPMDLWDRFSNGVLAVLTALEEVTAQAERRWHEDDAALQRAVQDLQASQARARSLEGVLRPFARFNLHGFDGVVLEVVPSSPDNPSHRIEPILKEYFVAAQDALQKDAG